MLRYISEGIARDGQNGKRVMVIVNPYDTAQNLMAQVLESSGYGRPHFNAFPKINYDSGGQVLFVTDPDDERLRGFKLDVVVSTYIKQHSEFVRTHRAAGAEIIVY